MSNITLYYKYIFGRGMGVNIFFQEIKNSFLIWPRKGWKYWKLCFGGNFGDFLGKFSPIFFGRELYFVIHIVDNNFYFHYMAYKCLTGPQTMDPFVPSTFPILEPSEGHWQAMASRNWKIPLSPTLLHPYQPENVRRNLAEAIFEFGGVGCFWPRT